MDLLKLNNDLIFNILDIAISDIETKIKEFEDVFNVLKQREKHLIHCFKRKFIINQYFTYKYIYDNKLNIKPLYSDFMSYTAYTFAFEGLEMYKASYTILNEFERLKTLSV